MTGKLLSKEINSIEYTLEFSKDSIVKYNQWERGFSFDVTDHLRIMFSTFISYEFDLMFGPYIWVRVSDNSELDSIIEFFEQRMV